MNSDPSQIDWAKAAAAWASQRKNVRLPLMAGMMQPQMGIRPMPPFGAFPIMYPGLKQMSPGLPMFAPPFVFPTAPFNMFPPLPAVGFPFPSTGPPGELARNLAPQHFFLPTAVSEQAKADPGDGVQPATRQSNRSIPQWLKEAVKNAESDTDSSLCVPNVEDTTESALLTPLENDTSVSEVSEYICQKQLIRKKVTDVLVRVTDQLIEEIAAKTVEEFKSFPRQPPQYTQPRSEELQAQQNHLEYMTKLLAEHRSDSVPSINATSFQPLIGIASIPGPSCPIPQDLHLHPSKFGNLDSISGQPNDIASDDELDARDDQDNDNLPIINPEEPTKGLFKAPTESYRLPPIDQTEDPKSGEPASSDVLNEKDVEEAKKSFIKVACLSRKGKLLGETFLNSRNCLIFGSNRKQANILDSHTSVYSQHCALAICPKASKSSSVPKSGVIPIYVYLFPIGGQTKINPKASMGFALERDSGSSIEQIARNGFPEGEKPIETVTTNACRANREEFAVSNPDATTSPVHDSSESAVPLQEISETTDTTQESCLTKPNLAAGHLSTPGLALQESKSILDVSAVELLMDGDKKRELPIESEIYIQLGSSSRHYLIDTRNFNKTHVLLHNGVPIKFLTSSDAEKLLSSNYRKAKSRNTSMSKTSGHSQKLSRPGHTSGRSSPRDRRPEKSGKRPMLESPRVSEKRREASRRNMSREASRIRHYRRENTRSYSILRKNRYRSSHYHEKERAKSPEAVSPSRSRNNRDIPSQFSPRRRKHSIISLEPSRQHTRHARHKANGFSERSSYYKHHG